MSSTCPHDPHTDNRTRVIDPDLSLIREDIHGELDAIVLYLRLAAEAKEGGTRRVLREIAGVEIGHFIALSRLLARLDPVQAAEYREHGLDFFLKSPADDEYTRPVGAETQLLEKWLGGLGDLVDRLPKMGMAMCTPGVPPTHVHDIVSAVNDFERLTMALEGELAATNQYQSHIEKAIHREVKDLLTGIMNAEKDHIASFSRQMYAVAHPPKKN